MAKFGLLSFLVCSCIIINAALPAQAQTASKVSKLSKTDPLNTVLLQVRSDSFLHSWILRQCQCCVFSYGCCWAGNDSLHNLTFQGFNWQAAKSSSPWYNVLKGIVEDAADAGITDVWFPPPSQSHPDGPEGMYMDLVGFMFFPGYGSIRRAPKPIQHSGTVSSWKND